MKMFVHGIFPGRAPAPPEKRVFTSCLHVICAVAMVLLPAGCRSLNTKNDYFKSRQSLEGASAGEAARSLPKKEGRSFITVMERTYLNLLDGKPEIDELFKCSRKIDPHMAYKISAELENMFYVETPEGYYASEHEIIWMHFLLSWGFSMRGQFTEARVEARNAAGLLSMDYSPQGRFDDAFMRVLVACTWAMAGDWQEARVDFRAAAALDPSLKWTLQLSELDTRPENLVIVLAGCGPEPQHRPTADLNLLRGHRNIAFVPSGSKSTLFIEAGESGRTEAHLTSDSARWYKRHLRRNNAINDLVNDSKYGQRIAFTATKATGMAAAGYTLAVVVLTGGCALGGGIVYLGATEGIGELVVAGVVLALAGTAKSIDMAVKTNDAIATEVEEDLDVSTTYRYVRFLPEYAWCFWRQDANGGEGLKYLLVNRDAQSTREVKPLHSTTVNGVTILFVPDVKADSGGKPAGEE